MCKPVRVGGCLGRSIYGKQVGRRKGQNARGKTKEVESGERGKIPPPPVVNSLSFERSRLRAFGGLGEVKPRHSKCKCRYLILNEQHLTYLEFS